MKIEQNKFLDNVFIFGLFLSIITIYERDTGDLPYFLLFITTVIVLIGLLFNSLAGRSAHFNLNFNHKSTSLVDKFFSKILIYSWVGVVVSWGYGAALGLINNVPADFVFRNFFGLLVYLIFPVFLLLSPSRKKLLIMIIFAGVIQSIYGAHAFFTLLIENPSSLVLGASLPSFRAFYSVGLIAIFPLFALSFANFVLPKKLLVNNYKSSILDINRSFLFLILFSFALIFPAMSKGYILATFMLALFILFVGFLNFINTGRINIYKAVFFIFILILFSVILFSYYEIVIFTYGGMEESNAIRSEQYEELISDISFFGHGLGSSLSTGYTRDETGYGMELTYLNIIHKIGVFSIFLFSSYLITLLLAAYRIIKGIYLYESIFALGLMGYLVVGAGNPILISSIGVTLHCLAMYFLVTPFLIQED